MPEYIGTDIYFRRNRMRTGLYLVICLFVVGVLAATPFIQIPVYVTGESYLQGAENLKLVEIISKSNRYFETWVESAHIGLLKKGQKVYLHVDYGNGKTMSQYYGRVVSIDRAPNQSNDGLYYKVLCSATIHSKANRGYPGAVRKPFRVQARFLVGSHSILNLMLSGKDDGI